MLVQVGMPELEIWQRIAEIGKEAGFDDEGLRRVLELASREGA